MDDAVHKESNPTQQVKITGAMLATEASEAEAGLQQGHDGDGGQGEQVQGEADMHEGSPGNGEPSGEGGENDLQLPSWTDPPTGVVPTVLREMARESGDTDEEVAMLEEGALHAPSWREHAYEWEALDVDVEVLFGEEVGVGEAGSVASSSVEEPAESSVQESVGVALEESGATHADGREDTHRRLIGSGQKGSGRSLVVAIASGLTIGGLALLSFYLGTLTAVIFCSVLVILASMECYATLRRAHRHPVTLIGLLGSLAAMIASYNAGLAGLAIATSATFVAVGIWLVLMPRARVRPVTRASSTIFGFLWIGMLGSYSALLVNPATFPHSHGIAFLLGAIIATVASDVGAYAVGSLYGHHKMAPVISPNKSWEGLAGAVVASVGVSAGILPMISPWTLSSAILLGVVVAVVSPLGDLMESMIKRELGVKDMGSMLPGHGGILDRIDGLLFVLPATFFLVSIIKI
ncbi:MAG: phosphatidate cytidylyltransferase [Actinobacteria bacterium]|nr:phosphatidate cytidylyltransferase [Actinomycetota bacterium]MCL5886393.1 phosphatidate cytidylyltransferase [Actinomycetota bacterium]